MELETGGVLNINDGEGADITFLGNGILLITSTNTLANTIKQNFGANIHIAVNGKVLTRNAADVGAGYENIATSLGNIWDDGPVYEFNSSSSFLVFNLTFVLNAASTVIPIFRVSKVARQR